jgi:hypothetical protein
MVRARSTPQPVTRRSALRLGMAGLAAMPLAMSTNRTATAEVTPVADGDTASWLAQMYAYAEAGSFAAVQQNAGGVTSTVMVEIPAIDFTGEGQSSTLPAGPLQYIYRFQDSIIAAPDDGTQTFTYVEIDWNTEGAPRGPNGAFASPHFDFHFYMVSHDDMMTDLTCVSSNGKTCDPLLTDYAQMRRFQNMPDARYIPGLYRADIGSAIPVMGLHLLDMTLDYTVDAVNHYPVLIYGTFDGKVIFAESSVTLHTLQDAINAPEHRLSFPFRQPAEFAEAIDWPTEFVIEYLPDTGGFQVGFVRFIRHEAS